VGQRDRDDRQQPPDTTEVKNDDSIECYEVENGFRHFRTTSSRDKESAGL
jgi:hypothetical protein